MSVRGQLKHDDDGFWLCSYPWAGREIEVSIEGSDNEIDGSLVDKIDRWLERLGELETTSIEYLRGLLAKRYKAGFSVTGVVFHDATQLTVTLAHVDDPHVIWRVEYDHGQPMAHGRDD